MPIFGNIETIQNLRPKHPASESEDKMRWWRILAIILLMYIGIEWGIIWLLNTYHLQFWISGIDYLLIVLIIIGIKINDIRKARLTKKMYFYLHSSNSGNEI